jgi:serine protease Do
VAHRLHSGALFVALLTACLAVAAETRKPDESAIPTNKSAPTTAEPHRPNDGATSKPPAPTRAIAARGASTDAKAPTAALDIASLREGLVVLEQAKRPIAVGLVLAGDGRILTALAPLGNGNSLVARYSNGTEKRLKMSATHRGMNLALLAPEDSRFNKGLRASRLTADDPAAHPKWLRGNQSNATALAAIGPLRKETLTGGDGFTLRDVFTLGVMPRPTEFGSVLVDSNGDVLGLVTGACQPNPNGECRNVACAIPVSMLKEFLRNIPEGASVPAPWIGMVVADADAGTIKAVRISAIDARGPVAALGLRAGKDNATADLLVAIDGVAVTSTKSFDELLRRRSTGERVRLLVYSDGRYREVTAVLGREPEHLADTSARRPADVGY